MADTVCELDCNYVDWDNVVGPLLDETDPSMGRDYSQGHVSDLLTIAVTQLGIAKGKGQLTSAEMGAAYAAIIPAAFREAINYELAEALAEMNIQNAGAELDLKRAQLEADKNMTEAELEKHWGYDVTRDADDNLVLGLSTDLGKIDREVVLVNENIESEDIKNRTGGLYEQEVIKAINEVRILGNKT